VDRVSPLYTSRALQFTLDLSQLSQLGEPFYFTENPYEDSKSDHTRHLVGFVYRIGASDPIVYQRPLRKGPPRIGNPDTMENPADTLLQVGEEMFSIKPALSNIHGKRTHIITVDKTPIAVFNLERDVASLLKAWTDWKMYEHDRQSQAPAGHLRPLPPV
jgi:hypothetical protein